MALLFFCSLAIGCTDAAPCSGCPDVSGTWSLVAESSDAGCAEALTPSGPLQIEQAESSIRAEFADQTLNGTLFDTFDFSLRSPALASPAWTLRGRYIPGTPDGGESLQGSLRSETRADGGTGCSNEVPFTATR